MKNVCKRPIYPHVQSYMLTEPIKVGSTILRLAAQSACKDIGVETWIILRRNWNQAGRICPDQIQKQKHALRYYYERVTRPAIAEDPNSYDYAWGEGDVSMIEAEIQCVPNW